MSSATVAATSSSPPPALLPSHTRSWSSLTRSKFSSYLTDREISVSSVPTPRIISGCSILIDYGRGRDRCQIDSKRPKFRAHSTVIDVNSIINETIGAEFEIEDRNGRAKKIKNDSELEEISRQENLMDAELPNNAELYDRNSSQSLTPEEIKSMKSSAPPAALVAALVDNSTTFSAKTEFSQEKYIAKKKRKYVTSFKTLPLIPIHAIDTARLNDPMRINHASNVQFSQLLAFANITAGNFSLSLDGTGGILTAAMAKRQGGEGFILAPHFNSVNSPLALNEKSAMTGAANIYLTEEENNSILHFPIQIINEKDSTNKPQKLISGEEEISNLSSISSHYSDALLALGVGVDSLVFVSRFDPCSLFRSFFQFLRPGACFALHCPSPAPLLALMSWLRLDNRAIKLELSDSWHREYQVLSQRTHPHVAMNQDTGTILSGMKTQ